MGRTIVSNRDCLRSFCPITSLHFTFDSHKKLPIASAEILKTFYLEYPFPIL